MSNLFFCSNVKDFRLSPYQSTESNSENFMELYTQSNWKGLEGYVDTWYPLQAVFTADILTCHSRKSTGVTNNINDYSVVFKCLSKSWQWGSK